MLYFITFWHLNDDDIHSQLVIFNQYISIFHYFNTVARLFNKQHEIKKIKILLNKFNGPALLFLDILSVSIVCSSTSYWKHPCHVICSVSILCSRSKLEQSGDTCQLACSCTFFACWVSWTIFTICPPIIMLFYIGPSHYMV